MNFSIKAEVIIRLLISFLILLILTPFRIIEAVLYHFARKEKVRQPIFIIGHPRSGTTFFHDSLNELESFVAPRMIDCLFPFLNKYFEFMLVPILEKALPETRLMDKMKVLWNSPQEEEFGMALMSSFSVVSFLFAPKRSYEVLENYVLLNNASSKSNWLSAHLKFAEKIQSMNKGKTLVFKSPGNTARISELLEIYPDAKFIHIVRDPQDVIPSTLHLYQIILPEFSLQDESKLNLKEYVFDYYELVMKKFLASKSKLSGDQFCELKYEEFIENPLAVLQKVVSDLKLKSSPDSLEAFFESRRNFSRNKFSRDPDLEKMISERCNNIIELYHYS